MDPKTVPAPQAYRALDVLRYLADYARREPLAGLFAQNPCTDPQTDRVCARAAKYLRGRL